MGLECPFECRDHYQLCLPLAVRHVSHVWTWCDDTAILRTALVKRVACISRTNVSHFHVVLEGLSLAVHSATLHLPGSSLRVRQTAHEKE